MCVPTCASTCASTCAWTCVQTCVVGVVDQRQLQPAIVLELSGPVYSIAFDPLHPQRTAAGCGDGKMRIVDLEIALHHAVDKKWRAGESGDVSSVGGFEVEHMSRSLNAQRLENALKARQHKGVGGHTLLKPKRAPSSSGKNVQVIIY